MNGKDDYEHIIICNMYKVDIITNSQIRLCLLLESQTIN